jgi:chloramphenicol O-acetyltransferase type A
MFQEIDLENWERKATFEFFRNYEDPFFNITANLNITRLYDFCKSNSLAFSLAVLFYSLETANEIREFRLRIVDEKVVEFDRIEATQTILNADNTFSFGYYQMKKNVFDFVADGKISRDKYLELKTFDVESDRIDLIYYSAFPWVSFTSFKHASRLNNRQTIPRMVFGKMFDEGGRRKMPFSVEVHHAMMDGFHVGQYFSLFQEKLDSL